MGGRDEPGKWKFSQQSDATGTAAQALRSDSAWNIVEGLTTKVGLRRDLFRPPEGAQMRYFK